MDTESRPLALVAGAAGSMGRELAVQCARHGFDLVLVANAPLDRLTTELRELGERVDTVETAIDSMDAIHAILAAIDGRSVDALFASAERFNGNQRAALLDLVSRIALEMSASEAGRILIVNPSDESSIDAYCCSLRADLKSSGVTVTCLHAPALDASSARLAEIGFDAMIEGDEEVAGRLTTTQLRSGVGARLV
ncbi:MAG: SDR family NAD(P)-dependent oxidoreductase [Steroidobacteraceae bacterium]